MSAPAFKVPHLSATLTSHAWWMLLLAALALLWLTTGRRIERVDALTEWSTWSVDAPRRDATSPTGYAQGQRRLVVPGHHNPSFAWIMEAQQSAELGSWRLRHIDYDAAPAGRETGRTVPYRWWLIAVGWLYGSINGEPLGFGIERGALLADPLLLALLLIFGAAYCARYLGSFAAIGFVVGGISLFPLAANFQPGAPDPHSLAWVFALGSILPLLVSTYRGAVGTPTRAHFVGAGICGGLGLWNDATTQMPVLLAIVLGALGYEFFRSRGTAQPSPVPLSWRAWACAGAVTAVGASVFEFAPDHFSWSLESVNPIHAVAWWGCGEVLGAAGRWFREGRKSIGWRSLVLWGVAGLAIAAWPVVRIVSGSGAWLAADFYALELANHPSGGIAPNVGVWFSRAESEAKWATLLPCLLMFVVLARVCRARADREERGRLALVFIAALFVVVLACLQLRWWNLFDVLVLAALAALLARVDARGTPLRWANVWVVVLVLPGLFVGFPPAVEGEGVKAPSPPEAQALIERDFAYWLARRAGEEPTVLFSTPIFSGAAAFYGGFATVVSSDDENKPGYLAAVRIASAVTEQEASVLLKTRGITHVALPLWDPALERLVRIGLILPAEQAPPQNALAIALREWDFPLWMRPLDYLIPREPGFDGFELRAYAVQAEQEPDLVLGRLSDFFVERGQLLEAKAVRESLKAFPRSVHTLGATANLDLALRDSAGLKESLEALIPHLSRRSARNLPADRRISLASLFIQSNHVDLAREQLTACFADLDGDTLRTLTPGSVVTLLALRRALDIPFPDPDLESVAMELIPPGVRSGLMPK